MFQSNKENRARNGFHTQYFRRNENRPDCRIDAFDDPDTAATY